jgi:hypothetical protein
MPEVAAEGARDFKEHLVLTRYCNGRTTNRAFETLMAASSYYVDRTRKAVLGTNAGAPGHVVEVTWMTFGWEYEVERTVKSGTFACPCEAAADS